MGETNQDYSKPAPGANACLLMSPYVSAIIEGDAGLRRKDFRRRAPRAGIDTLPNWGCEGCPPYHVRPEQGTTILSWRTDTARGVSS